MMAPSGLDELAERDPDPLRFLEDDRLPFDGVLQQGQDLAHGEQADRDDDEVHALLELELAEGEPVDAGLKVGADGGPT